mmetsp:Transcript_10418/g.29710  ORF Transcript_10418/g.29710 Transcript_10418/m.29710 type:complete len:238 (-) Transcript_10418:392-1105(-)
MGQHVKIDDVGCARQGRRLPRRCIHSPVRCLVRRLLVLLLVPVEDRGVRIFEVGLGLGSFCWSLEVEVDALIDPCIVMVRRVDFPSRTFRRPALNEWRPGHVLRPRLSDGTIGDPGVLGLGVMEDRRRRIEHHGGAGLIITVVFVQGKCGDRRPHRSQLPGVALQIPFGDVQELVRNIVELGLKVIDALLVRPVIRECRGCRHHPQHDERDEVPRSLQRTGLALGLLPVDVPSREGG